MVEFSHNTIIESAKNLLIEKGIFSDIEADLLFKDHQYQKIEADGSNRRFWRVQPVDFPGCIIIAPAGNTQNDLAESRSVWKIGNHMRSIGIPVPELYGWEPETGVIILEDLGDTRLQDITGALPGDIEADEQGIFACYCDVLKNLAKMQIKGVEGFQVDWCWDTPLYDVTLMLEKESRYFLRAFCQGVLGRDDTGDIDAEFRDLSLRASEASTDYFLHRDFQCRNIMIKDGSVRFIDFQGGRRGPLGYDIASLLLDPYAALSAQMQEKLLSVYMGIVGEYVTLEKSEFIVHFHLLALQRNLQIIGAFSYLNMIKGKTFFGTYIRPALLSLQERLEKKIFAEYSGMRTMVRQGLAAIKKN